MRALRFLGILGATSLLLLAAMPASANIYMDENFEGSAAFVDQNWPIQDNTTAPTAPAIASTQGINVRASATNQISPKVVMNNSGTLSTTYAFSGSKSLQLASGQSMAVNGTAAYINAGLNWYNTLQFAIAVNAATLALPASTQVGHFKMNYSTDNPQVLTTAEVTYNLNFVRNGTGGVDIQVVGTPGATTPVKVGEITAAGQWSMITVIVMKEIANSANDGLQNWENWDPLTVTYKGPQPTGNPIGDGSGNGTGTYAQLTDGFSLFINSNTAANVLSAAQIGANFCNSPALADNAKANDTFLMNWEIAAENGATLFVDETFWCHGLQQDGKGIDPETKEAAARMNVFGSGAPPTPTPTPGPPAAGASSPWSLYN